MTTERNALGVDGLAEVMGLLAANAPGFELNVTKRAAVNYLRSHGEAIRELVEAANRLSLARIAEVERGVAVKRSDYARLNAALAKFTEPRP